MSKYAYVLLSIMLSASSYCDAMNEKNNDGNTALHLAIIEENFLFAEMILRENKDIDFSKKNNDGETVLHLAASTCSDDNLAFVKLLLERGARSSIKLGDAGGDTALHIALDFVHPKIAELLIDEGADVNAVNDEKNSPLHYALEIAEKKESIPILKSLKKKLLEIENCDKCN
ncbi:hypothetical protein FACS1894122_03030 [Alphaproteobacteria bacterium]|nr:hypothetical protein FACS1894122_03030 [Alphaproteobacteria bacterium]